MENYYRNKKSSHLYRLNSFKLEGLEKLEIGYRLIAVSGLIENDEDYEKKIRQLGILISGQAKMPVEPIRVKGETRLAVTGLPENLNRLQIKDKYSLTPDDVFTTLEDETYRFKFNSKLTRIEYKLARRALDWAIHNALDRSEAGWWKYRRRFVRRRPLESNSNDPIQILPAFYFGFTPGINGGFELSINPSVCYAERKSTYKKYGQSIPANIKGKRFLYKNGLDFYPIDAVGIGKTAAQEKIDDPNGGGIISIQQHLKNRWGKFGLKYIDELDERALTVAYKTQGQKSRWAHSQLLFELVGVDGNDEGDEVPHNEAIMNPHRRGSITEQIINDLSPFLKLFGLKLQPSRQMRKLNGEVRLFNPPKIRVGGDEVLSTDLEKMGIDRFEALKHLGPADSSEFASEQMFVFGDSMPEGVRTDFKKRFLQTVKDLYGKTPNLQNIRFDDYRSEMRHQFNAIETAIGHRCGYSLMVLPKERKTGQEKKLHNALKRSLWERVHTQCASIESIMSFYQVKRGNFGEEWTVKGHKKGLYQSYLRYLALGYLEVNRKWLWKLAPGSLRNEVHVGIDVYQDLAVFTFIYGDADLITFRLYRSKRGERLSADLVREALVENLQADLDALGIKPSKIVFHRDGKVFRTEIKGIRTALKELKNSFSDDLKYAIVEIHKTSSSHSRLYRRESHKFENPEMGIFARFNDYEGILTTTGAPLLKRGTAQPLGIEVIEGNIDIDDIAHDIYALSHLSFASPGSAMSLPFTIALADRILRESSPGSETNLWEEEADDDEISESDVFTRLPNKMRTGGVAVI